MGSTSGSAGYYTSRCSLPSAWETRVIGSRNQQAMTYLRVEGTRVRYVGPGDEDSQVGCSGTYTHTCLSQCGGPFGWRRMWVCLKLAIKLREHT